MCTDRGKKSVLLSCQEIVEVVEVGQTSAVIEEEDDEESHFSEGQVIAVSSQSVSEISEELEEPEDGGSYLFKNEKLLKLHSNLLCQLFQKE